MRTLVLPAALIAGVAALAVPSAYAQTALSLDLSASADSPVTTQLQRFAASPDDLLFTGETQSRTLVFVAQPEQLGGATNLVLNLQSAISDAPESSHLRLALNGRDLGVIDLKAGPAYSVAMEVPAGVIQPGYNALALTVDQAHRVDCSIQATYELWTRIDPQLSGLQYAATAVPRGSFLAVLAAARSDAGRTPINGIVVGGERDDLLATIQALSIAGGFDRPDVKLGTSLGTGLGVDVIVGSMHNVAPVLEGKIDTTLHDGINIGRSNAGRPVVALIGEDPTDIARQITDLSHYGVDTNTGTQQGIAAVAAMRGAPLAANGRITLSALGIDDRTFSGRLYRQSTQFRMPADFYPADYARASIHLDADYAQGLAAGAQLLVKLNDRTVATLLLSGGRAGSIKDQILPISMMAFRAGLNNLTIEASLPATQDTACDPAHINDGGGRLRIAGTSYLELPDIARVGRFPDVGALETSITGRTSKALDVIVDSNNTDAANAAATFLAKLAYASGRVIEAHATSDAAYDASVPAVAIGGLDSLPAALVAKARISSATAVDEASMDDGSATASTWDQQLRDQADGLVTVFQSRAVQTAEDTQAAISTLAASFGIATSSAPSTQPLFIPPKDSRLLVAQSALSVDAPLTLIATPKSSDLSAAVSELVDSRVWNRLTGAAVSFADDGNVLKVGRARGSQLFFSSEPSSIQNARLIAAGWLSNNPAIYVIVLFVFASFLGLATSLVLVRGRGRS